MKGVEAIIAIILILMIVVALAALAYTWFSGIFTGLTTTASNATGQVTTAMGTQAKIEAAKYLTAPINNVTVTIRNMGTQSFELSKMIIYVDGKLTSFFPVTGTVAPSSIISLNVSNTTISCNKEIKITLETGFEDYVTITC